MSRARASILCAVIATLSMAGDAQVLPSPEAAFEAYERARLRNDVPGYLATISFRQEALELLRRTGNEPTEGAIAGIAAKREAELRKHLETRGFTKDGDCELVTKLRDSEEQVRFILSCKDASGATFFPVRVMHSPDGWLVVRGG
jgi:hypothetical protein